MANNCADCDHDSAFGDEDDFWTSDPMFSLGAAVAGTKRAADDLKDDAAQTRGQSTPSQLEHASSAPTPALSHSNYTSLESAFTTEPSPGPGQTIFPPHCYLGVDGDHCHIDNSCCHGPQRACGDVPSASQQQLDLWSSSIASGNGLASNFMNFGFSPSLPTSPVSADCNSIHSSNPFSLGSPMTGFNDQTFHDQSWMLTDSAFPNTFQPADSFTGANKLDFLASAVQNEILRPSTSTLAGSSSASAAGAESQACICKCAFVIGKDAKHTPKISSNVLSYLVTFSVTQVIARMLVAMRGARRRLPPTKRRTTMRGHIQARGHIALHEGKKPHKCRFCEFTCADSSNLSKHERTHQTLRPYKCPHPNCTFKPDCRWENLKRHMRRSGHCPQLLVETSEEYKSYREGVRREIDDWHKRNEDGGLGKAGRRKGRA
ncbi:hypothetical protein G6011_09952 [Alternaria panax]|uniref:C2H2-type domain-containing protein n=1 Tax=Alternaria panax TaxID=48097 RepID=A0AAD4FG09_9PLEO|nr:hypothetical protein G6011_09952 [Alternaria panax]